LEIKSRGTTNSIAIEISLHLLDVKHRRQNRFLEARRESARSASTWNTLDGPALFPLVPYPLAPLREFFQAFIGSIQREGRHYDPAIVYLHDRGSCDGHPHPKRKRKGMEQLSQEAKRFSNNAADATVLKLMRRRRARRLRVSSSEPSYAMAKG